MQKFICLISIILFVRSTSCTVIYVFRYSILWILSSYFETELWIKLSQYFFFLFLKKGISLDFICFLQGNYIKFCRNVRTSSPIGIMPLRSAFQAINVDALFMPVMLFYKSHLLKNLQCLCLCFCFINYTSWDFFNDILQYLCI